MSNVHALNVSSVRGPIADTLINLLSGLGTAKDKTTSTHFVVKELDRSQLFFAYRGDWIARKIVDCPAQDSTREWRAWQAEKKQITEIEKVEKDLRIQLKVKQAMQRARLLGGAALILGVDQGTPDQELRVDRVRAGQLKYVHVVNRDEIAVERLEYDVTSEYYGEPTAYTVNSADRGMIKLHPSRVIRFIGNEIPDLQLTANGWGDSVLQAVYDAVIQAGQTSANVASLVNEAKTDVVGIPDMMSHMGTAEYRAKLIERFTLASSMKSLTNTLLLDKEEEWNRVTSSFAGLHDLIHVYLMMASGAADIPATRLLGQSAKGLNATGHEDTRNYYDRLSSDQRNDLGPRLGRLDEVLLRSVLGSRPEEITYEWNSLWQLTETEAADVAAKKATVYTADVNANLIPPEVLREGRENQLIEDGTYPGLEQAIDAYGTQNLDEYNQAVVAQMGARAALMAPDNPNDPNAPNKKAAAAKAELARRKALPPPRPPAARSQDELTEDETTPRSLYVRRDVLNGEEILKHFEDQGVDTSDYDPADLHVTILYSRQPVDWIEMGEAYGVGPSGGGDLPEGVDMRVNAGGPRVMEAYGLPPDTLVMCFASSALCYRHESMICEGASEDYGDFNPHVSVARWDGVDPRTIEPWQGEILLGPEIFEPVKQGGTEGETLDAYDPSEPRAAAGSGQGGQWTSEGAGSWAGRLHEAMRDNAGFDAVVAELKSSKVTQSQMHAIATEFFTKEWGKDPGFARSKSKGELLKSMVDWQAVDARQRARMASHAHQGGAEGETIDAEWNESQHPRNKAGEFSLSERSQDLLSRLRDSAESDDGNGWWAVYLDNARPPGMSALAFAGHLSALQKAGLYRPVASDKTFGQVRFDAHPETGVPYKHAKDWRADVDDYRPDQLRGKGGRWAKEGGGGKAGASGRSRGAAKTAAGAKGAGAGAKASEKRRAQFEQNANYIRRLNAAGNDRKKFEAVMKDLDAAGLTKDQLVTILRDYRLTASMIYSARMSKKDLLGRFRADFTQMRRFLNKVGMDAVPEEYEHNEAFFEDYSPDQPREPAGSGRGGQFSTIVGSGLSAHAGAAGLDVKLLKTKRLASGASSAVDLSTRAQSGLLKPMSVEVAQEFRVGSKWRKNPDQAGDYAAGIGLMLARQFPGLARFAEQFWYDAAAGMTPKEYAYAKSYFATRDGAFSEGYRAAFSPNGKAFGLSKARTEEVFGRSVGQLRTSVDSAIRGSSGSGARGAGVFARMGSRLAKMIGA